MSWTKPRRFVLITFSFLPELTPYLWNWSVPLIYYGSRCYILQDFSLYSEPGFEQVTRQHLIFLAVQNNCFMVVPVQNHSDAEVDWGTTGNVVWIWFTSYLIVVLTLLSVNGNTAIRHIFILKDSNCIKYYADYNTGFYNTFIILL